MGYASILMHSWETSIHPLKSVDTKSNVVEFAAPLKEWWGIAYWEKAHRYYVENARELLDQPGEWYLNRKTGVLRYWPMPGEKPGGNRGRGAAPQRTGAIGGQSRPRPSGGTHNVPRYGVSPRGSGSLLKGNSSMQANVEVPAAIVADGARHCTIESCEVAHVGAYGLWFRRGCKDCLIQRNRLFDLGVGGKILAWSLNTATKEMTMKRTHGPTLSMLVTLLMLSLPGSRLAAADGGAPPRVGDRYVSWSNGPGRDPGYFPLAVWLQSPKNAAKYKAIGINLFVALWEGPTAEQLAELKRQGMPVICEQNGFALEHLDEKIVVGWMHGDEPDNAQPQGKGKGYGPPILPSRIVADYARIKTNDPSRPVMLNLGQGVAWDGWYGRGVRTNHPEDYPEYARGGDIVSFDIYPAVHDKPAVAGKLWYVARGVERLRRWAGDDRIVWNCIECTRIGNTKAKPTPQQVKAEVWMSIVHGSRGLIYFCHQFQPRFIEAGLLADDEMARAAGAINRQIHDLAAVINSPSIPDGVTVKTTTSAADADRARALATGPIATMVKKHGGAVYVFAVRMESTPVKGRFDIRGVQGKAAVEALGEDRTIDATDGAFTDDFGAYAVHLYKIRHESKTPD